MRHPIDLKQVSRLSSFGLQTYCNGSFTSSTFGHSIDKMSSENHGFSVCPGTVLSVFCLFLYSAGFIRIEVKFNDSEQRLVAVEEVFSHMKQRMADTLIKGKVCLDFFPLMQLRRLLICVCIFH